MITKDMVLGEIMRTNSKAIDILGESGMHCLGCPSSQMETLEEACFVHGLKVDELLSKLNG